MPELTENPPPADVLLSDGTIAVIRLLRPGDADHLHELHQQLSEETLRLRFFSVGRAAAHQYVDHLVRDRPLAMVLEQDGELLAVATAEPVGSGTAEVSFLVEDGRHGLGIGSLLLEHLAAAARASGIATFVADVLLENHAMLDVMTDAGFTVTQSIDEDVVDVRLDTRATPASQAAADARDRRAEARSLHRLFHPRSVAVAGVRADGRGVGRAVLDNIRAGGFTGRLHVVHPRLPEVDGIPAASAFVELPSPVDLAVIAVPAGRVLDTVAAAADAHVPVAVVISSGFRELGEDGARLQRDLAVLARSRSIRLVGPNCLGVIANARDTMLNATFTDCVPPSGGLAVATQSGGVGIVLADMARDLGVGIASLVSLGNKVDVSGNDLLAVWTDDPQVSAGALYLESFGNARKFGRIARRFSEHKPLLAVVGGQSDGGRRAGASHTAASATPAVGIAALFSQAGVIACDGAEDLAETALLLTREPRPAGPRLAVVSNAGGMGVLAADTAAACGLVVPVLSPETQSTIAGHVLGTVGTSNPVDAGAAVAADELATIVDTVLRSGEVDALLVELVATSLSDIDAALRALAEVRERSGHLPVLTVLQGRGRDLPDIPALTAFRSSTAAVRALSRAVRYAAWLAERTADVDAGTVEPDAPESLLSVQHRRSEAVELLENEAGRDGWLGADAAARLLGSYGLEPAGGIAQGVVAVAGLATSIGFPVALKVADSDVVHRTERGLVRIGLPSAEAVKRAVTSFERELGRQGVSVLVQPVVSGVEMAVGVVRDRSVGPLVMVGAGGVNTDVLDDRAYLMTPVGRGDVRRALRGLRCWPLLAGFRGSAPVDIEGLVDLVVSCGRLADEIPQVAEVDLNPVMLSSTSRALVDVKLRLDDVHAPAADEPRQLRRTT